MNLAQVTTLREAIKLALKDVEARYDVTLELGRARYTSDAVSFQFNLVENTITDNGASLKGSLKEADFRQNHHHFGLELTDLGRTFLSRGQQYTIAGSKCRNHRYPILALDRRGTLYKFPVATVRAGLIVQNSR